MSLDDETPTQYFGPGAEVWVRPDGSTVQLHPDRIEHLRGRLEAEGWVHSGKEPLIFGPEVVLTKDSPEDNTVTFALSEHRVGCSHSRTGRCICAYLAQWDKYPSYTAPTFNLDTPALAGAGVMVLPDEMWDDLPASFMQAAGAPEFISASEHQARQAKTRTEPRLQLPIVIASTTEDPAVIAEKIIKDNPGWFGELRPGTYQKREEDTNTARLENTERSLAFWKEQAKHWKRGYWIMAALSMAGWGLAAARGIWGF